MKKKHMRGNSPSLFMSSGIIVIFLGCLFNISALAQNSGNGVVSVDDQYKAYMEKFPASPLVKMYKHNSGMNNSAQAMRYAAILEKPEFFGTYSQSDLAHMRSELNNLLTVIESIDASVQKGETYEKASAMYARQIDTKQALDAMTRGEQREINTLELQAIPTITVPKQ